MFLIKIPHNTTFQPFGWVINNPSNPHDFKTDRSKSKAYKFSEEDINNYIKINSLWMKRMCSIVECN